MRFVIVSGLILALAAPVLADSNFSFEPASVAAIGSDYEQLAFHIQVTNLTTGHVVMTVEKDDDSLPADWMSMICVGDFCYGPSIDSADFDLEGEEGVDLIIYVNIGATVDFGEVAINVSCDIGGEVENFVLCGYHENYATIPPLTVTTQNLVESGDDFEQLQFYAYVTNLMSGSHVFAASKAETLPADWFASICVGDYCYGPMIDVVDIPIDAYAMEKLSLYMNIGTTESVGTVLMTVSDGPLAHIETYTVTGVHDALVSVDPGSAPGGLLVQGNFPNPFNPRTTIRFQSEQAGAGRLEIADIEGRVIRCLDLLVETGENRINLEAVDGNGHSLPSGTYLYRIVRGGSEAGGKMTLIK